MYPEELERLISAVIADGRFTEKERSVIRRKAQELNINPDEVEIIVEGRLSERNNRFGGSMPVQPRSFVEENKTALIVAGIAGGLVLLLIITVASAFFKSEERVQYQEEPSPTYQVETEDVTSDDFQQAMDEATEQIEAATAEGQEELENSMDEVQTSTNRSSSSSSSYSSDDDDDDNSSDDSYSSSYYYDDDATYSDDQNTRLKAKTKAAYHKAKEKTKEKWEEVKQSESYQNAKEKASELKQGAKDKAEELLDKWLNK